MEGPALYNVLDELLDLLFYMVEGYCLCHFYDSFLESRMHSRKWTGTAVILLYGNP